MGCLCQMWAGSVMLITGVFLKSPRPFGLHRDTVKTALAANTLWLWLSGGTRYRFVVLTDYDRFPENIDMRVMVSPACKTYHHIYVRRDDSGGELADVTSGDSKWRRKSSDEAPPTTGIFLTIGDRRRWYWLRPHWVVSFSASYGCHDRLP